MLKFDDYINESLNNNLLSNKDILSIVLTLEQYPIEVLLCKYLINNQVGEEKLIELLKRDNLNKMFGKEIIISQGMKVKLQNSMRYIEKGLYKLDKIPSIFK